LNFKIKGGREREVNKNKLCQIDNDRHLEEGGGRENEIRGGGKMVGGWFFNFVDLTKKNIVDLKKLMSVKRYCKKIILYFGHF
jgi:hypothetical protein